MDGGFSQFVATELMASLSFLFDFFSCFNALRRKVDMTFTSCCQTVKFLDMWPAALSSEKTAKGCERDRISAFGELILVCNGRKRSLGT